MASFSTKPFSLRKRVSSLGFNPLVFFFSRDTYFLSSRYIYRPFFYFNFSGKLVYLEGLFFANFLLFLTPFYPLHLILLPCIYDRTFSKSVNFKPLVLFGDFLDISLRMSDNFVLAIEKYHFR